MIGLSACTSKKSLAGSEMGRGEKSHSSAISAGSGLTALRRWHCPPSQ